MEFSLTDTPIQAEFFRDLLNGSQFPALNKIVIFFNATKSLDSLRAILAQDLSRIKSFHFNASGFQLRPNEGRDQSILSFLREHQLNEVVLKGALFTQEEKQECLKILGSYPMLWYCSLWSPDLLASHNKVVYSLAKHQLYKRVSRRTFSAIAFTLL